MSPVTSLRRTGFVRPFPNALLLCSRHQLLRKLDIAMDRIHIYIQVYMCLEWRPAVLLAMYKMLKSNMTFVAYSACGNWLSTIPVHTRVAHTYVVERMPTRVPHNFLPSWSATTAH